MNGRRSDSVLDGGEGHQALVVRENTGGRFSMAVERVATPAVGPDELLVAVDYSSLNYKDALSATGNRGVTRNYPHTPGIDAAGVVVGGDSPRAHVGEPVIVTGYDLGMDSPGGFAEMVKVPAPWVLRPPRGLSTRDAMRYGTAGLTAGLSVRRLLSLGLSPDRGPVVVTGATGGVGSYAVAILARAKFRVTAVTSKREVHAYLRSLGAAEVITPDELLEGGSERPLLHGQWQGAVDSLGGRVLSTLVRSLQYGGAVAVCGNAASVDLPLTVYPFILRGVTVSGIDSASCPRAEREEVWDRLASDWSVLDANIATTEVGLAELPGWIERMLSGGVTGRLLVNPRMSSTSKT